MLDDGYVALGEEMEQAVLKGAYKDVLLNAMKGFKFPSR